ncbi:DUF1772 domain-containing protein [Asanoa sp. WMMD1127]|uniref:DUF1772 domain-containing protein n=1 Tax=Asanoa sp. WMMD1127 TaxID=3016107 RepID=UPI0024178569|nr:DUF1772 domain-containing protein [Asanoa sp. WMMD1127]MDG4820755.1 DUF1772 domain-containing protein [Asanoa sp. WMMD1127]
MTEIAALVALVGNGLTFGVMLATAMGIVPFTLVLPYRQYVQTIQFLWPRYDPFMPIAHTVTVLAGGWAAVVAGGALPRALFGTAAVVLVLVMVISVVKNVPINRYVMSLDPGAAPADWSRADPRARWRAWNLLRTSLAGLALVLNAAAAASL